ncbi:MAG: AfsR/SARP family transcriptional regulator, partial [Moorellales bacterium]
MLRVSLLGHFGVTAPTGEVFLPTTKVRHLAAFVFWQQGRWVRRELLREMLWGEVEEQRAAGSLRTALYSLRRCLVEAGAPKGILEVRREAVRVAAGPECLVDAHLFEEKAWAGLKKDVREVDTLMEAASLYQGEFLEDLDADWCLPERRRLNDLYLAVLR